MDDIQDLKNVLRKERLASRVSALKFTDVFSNGLQRYPKVHDSITKKGADLPIVTIDGEIVCEGSFDMNKILFKIQSL
ncbi:MAG: hypothetical protein ACOYVK_19080 [Bacillota bacterium]